MNETLINAWNEVVGEKDKVYHLGDFALGNPLWVYRIMKRLNGKIYLVKGNHERSALDAHRKHPHFEWVKEYFELTISDEEIKDQLLVLCHYPFLTWRDSHRGSWNLYGHVHEKMVTNNVCQVNVGVDSHDYNYLDTPYVKFAPLSYEQIKEIVTIKSRR